MRAVSIGAVATLVVVSALTPSVSAAAAREWRWPVDAGVSRGFSLPPGFYAAGGHRGVDFGAASGSPVRAACAGRVTFAGRVPPDAGVVTVSCGPWRVTHLPLASVSVRPGSRVRAGAALGVLGDDAGHTGLHLGVRRAADRHGYVDPLAFLSAGAPASGSPLGRFSRRGPSRHPPGVRTAWHEELERSHAARAPVPDTASPPVAERAPTPVASPQSRSLAPIPVWIGLALLLAGGVGACRRGRQASARSRWVARVARAESR
jgi:hypothetical protein